MQKLVLFLISVALLTCAFLTKAICQQLPTNVPSPIGPDGRYTQAIRFTTMAYQEEALNRVLQEANLVANELNLPEELPITKSNMVKAFISPFGFAYAKKAIGNVTTRNYAYYVSMDNKFSYLESPYQFELCQKFQTDYTLPSSMFETNQAVMLATQWLAAVSMDVAAISRDCVLDVKIADAYVHAPAGKFVPVYNVVWVKKTDAKSAAASVRVFTPTRTLLQLRVEDSKYILRPPIVFTNLAELLSQTNVSGGVEMRIRQ